MSVWSKTITLAFLLLFSVQSFSYPVLLLRYYHHFDCSGQEKKDCHGKDARSHCTGNCSLTQQLKSIQENDNELVANNLVPCPETPALVQLLVIEPAYILLYTAYPDNLSPCCLEGPSLSLFHPPLN